MRRSQPTLFRQNVGLLVALIVFSQLSAAGLFFYFSQKPRIEVFTLIAARNIATVKNTVAALPPEARAIYLAQINQGEAIQIGTHPPEGAQVEPRGLAKMVVGMLTKDLEKSAISVGLIERPERRLVASWHQDGASYWVTFPELPLAPGSPLVWLSLSMVVGLLSLAGAWLIEKHLHRPLDELVQAVRRVGTGAKPLPLAEDGPREIAALAAGFNRMVADLSAIEQQRVLMLAGVSHDLRTPLTKMRLALGILEAQIEPELLQQMVRGIEDMDRLVGQFLDFARVDSDESEQQVDLRLLVAECLEHSRLAPDQVDVGAMHATDLVCRPQMMRRLVTNLIDNAFKYGRIDAAHRLVIETDALADRVVLSFRDHGPGFAESVATLTRPFVRGADVTAPGSGLGLAIVARIVALHHGTLELNSHTGGGQVRIELPKLHSQTG
jgi:two-component system osmolarity sensor histidine kinase EnvZ